MKVRFFLPPRCMKGMRWSEQMAIWTRLSAGSALLRRLSVCYVILSAASYFAFFFFVLFPLLDSVGPVACGLFGGFTFLVLDEALKHLILAPEVEREIARVG
jgi:hypothetical protein